MKKLLLVALLISFQTIFSQNKVATTEDGKKVILKKDKTWEYAETHLKTNNPCNIEKGFKEPKWNKSKMWKRMGTRVDDLKNHISVDMGVNKKKIILLQLSEQLGNAVYILCVDGKKMKYRRTGSVFRKDGEDALKMD